MMRNKAVFCLETVMFKI